MRITGRHQETDGNEGYMSLVEEVKSGMRAALYPAVRVCHELLATLNHPSRRFCMNAASSRVYNIKTYWEKWSNSTRPRRK